MGNDIQSYRSSIGHFYCKTHSLFVKKVSLKLYDYTFINLLFIFIVYCQSFCNSSYNFYKQTFLTKPASLLVILMLILLSNDVKQNPGPPVDAELSIFHLNSRSMRQKVDYIESICNEADIICLTETHLDENIKNQEIYIEGYCEMPFRKDRNSSGGGVIVYTNNNLNVKSRPDLDFDGEVIWLEIDMPRCKLLLCTVYRPPNAEVSFWDNFQQSVENALNSSQYVVITGDLNIDLLTNHENRLVNLIRLHGLKNLITEPTRISNTRQSLLDPILVSTHCDIHDSFVIPVNRLMSDHEATIVFVKFPLNCNKTYKRLVYDYKNADFETCNECISSFNWETILSIDNSMDKNCQNFTDKFIEFIKKCVPQKEVIIRPKDKIWFNSELRKEIRKRDRLHKQARKSKTVHDITKYKKQRNHVNNLKKFAKEQFYLNANNLLNEFSSSNPKSHWSLVKKLIKTQGNSISISQLKNDDGVFFFR